MRIQVDNRSSHRIVHHFPPTDLECLNVAETHVRFDAVCHHLSHPACIRQGKSVRRSTLLSLPSSHPPGQGPSHRCGSNAKTPRFVSHGMHSVTNDPPPPFRSSRSGYAQRCCRNPKCRPRALSATPRLSARTCSRRRIIRIFTSVSCGMRTRGPNTSSWSVSLYFTSSARMANRLLFTSPLLHTHLCTRRYPLGSRCMLLCSSTSTLSSRSIFSLSPKVRSGCCRLYARHMRSLIHVSLAEFLSQTSPLSPSDLVQAYLLLRAARAAGKHFFAFYNCA